MQAAIIPADNAQPIRFEEITPELKTLQALARGDVQLVGLRRYAMNMYLNENGKLESLPANSRATTLCHWAEAIRADDFICGDAIVLGPIDGEGEETGLRDVQVEWLREFGVQLSAGTAAE